MHAPPVPSRPSERGAALLVVMMALIVCGAMSMGLLALSTSRSKAAQNRSMMESALESAEAGIDYGLAWCNKLGHRDQPTNTWLPNPPAMVSFNTYPNANLYQTGFYWQQVGRFRVSLLRGDGDGIDNDLDGLLDGLDAIDEMDYITIKSIGQIGNQIKTVPRPTYQYEVEVRCMIVKRFAIPNIQAGVLIDDPNPDLQLGNSNSYIIDGRDHDMYSDAYLAPPAGDPPLPAFGTTSPAGFNAADAASMDGNSPPADTQIMGTSPTYQGGMPDNINIADMMQFGADYALPQHRVTGGPGTVTNPPGFFGVAANDAPPTEPVMFIQYYSGPPGTTFKFTGNTTGAGILIVDGDLYLGGGVVFTGIIIAKGKVTFAGGGPDNHVTGAVIAGDVPLINFDVNGTIDILYSSAAVRRATNMSARFVVGSWQRIAVEP